MPLAPTLHTERLILRGHQEGDLDDCVALWSDPDVTQYTTGAPLPRQDVWLRLLRHPGHWAVLGFGYWLAFERLTGRFVGEVGVARFKRDLLADLPELDPLPEAGWVFMPWSHGQGFATEAVRAVLAWRDTSVTPPGTFCIIQPENAASLRLAAKVGFQPYQTAGHSGRDWLVLMRP
ncbi:GNAT family N-acetyltransferase [Deinococcus hopiensis]|uniref:Protein N-acetyltransferase, RimJ/RimL family n=1 Tax=Deinococcus hopiensis KR-140 TaxID=695939 RepID=A0A1W1V5M4_9DEIO|nr:GNAT family N-acetyltransferase [Deinococcus hopiensis]SMB88460.1 Protein N-acetyltransferase, RimJ/RimL family [Deinococcus hopiensis KR-140]